MSGQNRAKDENWKNPRPVDQQPLSVSGTLRMPSAQWAMHVETATDGTRRVPDTLPTVSGCHCRHWNDSPGRVNYAQPLHPKLRTWCFGAESRACEQALYESRGKRIMHIGFSPNSGKIDGAQHRTKILCPLALAKTGRLAFLVFAYDPTTDCEHEHNFSPWPART